jgi:Tail tubular protein
MGLYSYKDAINHMLLSSGEHLVSDLNNESGVDTSVADFILKQTIKATVMRGIANNRYVTTLPINNEGKITLPTNACYAQVVEPLFDPTTGEVIQTTIKSTSNGPVLFNITKQTDVFDRALKVEVIVTLGNESQYYGWDDIDSALQRGIMESAAREYQVITQGDLDVDKRMALKEQTHMARGRAADIFKKNRSIFLGDPGTRAAVDRRGILSNDPYFTRTRF